MRVGELKVLDGLETIDGKQVHIIVAATSQRSAVAALANFGVKISVRRLMTYWTETGNRKALETALAAPGVAFAERNGEWVALPRRAAPPPSAPAAPKVPKDPEGRRLYDKEKRVDSDASKRERGERRVNVWLPKEAATALDILTGGSKERGAVQAAMVAALMACADKAAPTKRKAA